MAFTWWSEGEKLDCSTCTARDKVARGCDGKRRWRVGEYYVQGCPNKLFTPDVWQAIEAWSRWKTFGWPYAGGWAEQPARFFDVVDALERQCKVLEARRIEAAKNGSRNR